MDVAGGSAGGRWPSGDAPVVRERDVVRDVRRQVVARRAGGRRAARARSGLRREGPGPRAGGARPLRHGILRELELRLLRGEPLRLLLNPSLVLLNPLLIRIDDGGRRGGLGRRPRLRRRSGERHDARHHDGDADDEPLLQVPWHDARGDGTMIGDRARRRCGRRRLRLIASTTYALLPRVDALEDPPLGAEHQIATVENLRHDVRAVADFEVHQVRRAVFQFVERRAVRAACA